MSIFSTTKQEKTITEGWRALELFTDRHEASRCFIEYMNVDPCRKQILFFYGDGGNGKSLLLRFLRESCCKRLPYNEWWAIHQQASRALVETVEQASDEWVVPSGYLDFGMPPRGEERPQEAFTALLMLRRQLAGHGLHFPLYDFATILYLQKTGQLSDERLRTLFPADEIDFMIEFADNIFDLAGGGLLKSGLGLVNSYLRQLWPSVDEKQAQLQEWWTLYLTRRQITAEDIAHIQRMDPHKELVDELPRLFAQDLNVAMTMDEAPKRVVLFFDTHEAFWGQQRHLAHDLYFQRDEWLRRLLGHLDFQNGIVAVGAGREAPRWHNANRLAIPKSFLNPFLIGHFAENDALEYLAKADVSEPDLQHALVGYTQVAPDQIHPFYLGLSVDVIQAAQRQGQALTADDFAQVPGVAHKQRELVHSLLRYVDNEIGYAVRALSACCAFNRHIYDHLGQTLRFHATSAAFETLTRFSFVWPANERGEGWYRIHDLLRRLFGSQNEQITHQAHTVLEAYHRQQPNEPTAIAEAIYHANRLEWERGVREWVERFDKALELSHYDFCSTLLDVRNDLSIESDFQLGRVSLSEGQYFAQLSRHAEARQEYQEAIDAYQQVLRDALGDVNAHLNLGIAYGCLGELQASRSEHSEALASYQKAIAAFDESLHRAPDDVAAHNNLGNAYQCLGQLQASRSSYTEALASYQKAITAFDKALCRAPDDVAAHNNQGIAYLRLGELQASRSSYTEALASYQKAIAAFDEALRRVPSYVAAHLNLGSAYGRLGKLQASFSEYSEALASYQKAIAAFDEALRRAPDDVTVHNNLGNTYQGLGEFQFSLYFNDEALASYQKAIAIYDQALRRAPDHVAVHNSQGSAYQSLGELQASRSSYTEALASYQKAIAAYQQVLRRAPDDVAAHTGEGNTYQRLGELQASHSEHTSALASYQKAIAAYDQALRRAPDDVTAHNNQGIAYWGLGELQASRSEHTEALANYQKAIAAFDEALRRAPDDVAAHTGQGNTYQGLGELQASRSSYTEALASYQKAIAAYDQALRRAQDNVAAHTGQGNAYQSQGELQASRSSYTEALASYQKAIAAYHEALRRAPDDVTAHNNQGIAYWGLGELQASRSEHTEALANYQKAIAAFDEALRRTPNDVDAHCNMGEARTSMAKVQVALAQHDEAISSYAKAIAACQDALQHAPNEVQAHNRLGQAYLGWGKLQIKLGEQVKAMQSFEAARAACNRSLEIAPNNEKVRRLRDKIQGRIEQVARGG